MNLQTTGHVLGMGAAIGAAASSVPAGVAVITGLGITSAGIVPAAFAAISVLCYVIGDYVYKDNPYFAQKMTESLGRLLVLAFLTIVDYATKNSIALAPLSSEKRTPLQLLDEVKDKLATDAEGVKLVTLYRELLEMMGQAKKNTNDLAAALSIAEAIILEMFTIHNINVSSFNYDKVINSSIPPSIASRETAPFWIDFEQKLFQEGRKKYLASRDVPQDDLTLCNSKITNCCKGYVSNGYQCVEGTKPVPAYSPGVGGARSRRKRSRRSKRSKRSGGCWSKKK